VADVICGLFVHFETRNVMMMITVLNIGIVRQCAIGMRVAAAIYHYSPVISASVSVVIIIEMSALGICFVLWLRWMRRTDCGHLENLFNGPAPQFM
jgi:hypothetical protein